MDNLINKYFSQSATHEEIEELLSWIKESKENEAYFLELRKIWHISEVAFLPEDAVYKALEKTNQRLMLLKRRENKKQYALRVAATVALLVMFSTGAFLTGSWFEREKNTSVVINKIITGEGNRSSVVLPDGSVVWLNAGSTLSYPEKFDKNRRTVRLEGEGYFDVARDEKTPFIVESGDLSIQVLGTDFDVCNYAEKDVSHVVLLSGKVEVGFSGNTDRVILTPGEKLSYYKQTSFYHTEQVETSDYTLWTLDKLIFDGESLERVLDKLAHWYGVTILAESEIPACQFLTFTIHREPIEEILQMISRISPVEYRIENDLVYIK